ncbi:MAG: hypothetical protein ACPGQL_04170 [Thermoplasmatota archaeon]
MTMQMQPEDAIRGAFDLFKHAAEHPDTLPGDVMVIPLEMLVASGQGLSRERLRLLLALRQDGPFDSLDAVAAHLRRDKTRLSKDVRFLEGLGLVESQRQGRQKRLAAVARPLLID